MNVAAQIVGSGFSSTELRNKATNNRKIHGVHVLFKQGSL